MASNLTEYMKAELTAIREEQAQQHEKLDIVYGVLHELETVLQQQHQTITERLTDTHATAAAILAHVTKFL